MERYDIDEIIIAKLTDKKMSDGEEKLFEEWYGDADNRTLYEALMRQQAAAFAGKAGEVDTPTAWERIKPRSRRPVIRHIMRYAAAAAVVAAASITTWIATERRESVEKIDVKPGEFMAVLTSDGQKTFLSQSDMVGVAGNGKTKFSSSSEGLIMEDTNSADDGSVNILSVPRGGHYKVSLSDGTVVWLNSESSLRFPSRFTGDLREVYIDGEAYFKVAVDREKPFVVTTGGYDVRVTGTEFNVRNYDNEPIATTLVEGSVQVEHEGSVTKLNPGEQAVLDNGHILVGCVNTDDFTAWQQGAFSFHLERLEDIMTELSRWYNIDIAWQNPALKEMRFSAWFSRDANISEIMEILEKTRKVSLSLQDNTLTVSR